MQQTAAAYWFFRALPDLQRPLLSLVVRLHLRRGESLHKASTRTTGFGSWPVRDLVWVKVKHRREIDPHQI